MENAQDFSHDQGCVQWRCSVLASMHFCVNRPYTTVPRVSEVFFLSVILKSFDSLPCSSVDRCELLGKNSQWIGVSFWERTLSG